MVKINKVSYGGWSECLQLTNGEVEAIVTTMVGPRIIRYGFCGGENMLHEISEHLGDTNSEKWLMYGGHRLWHSPQVGTRPNEPDNKPIKYEIRGAKVYLDQGIETLAKIGKKMEIEMHSDGSLTVTHSMCNYNAWPVELSIWPLTVMSQGGVAVVPIPQNNTRSMPNCTIARWPFTKLNDKRLTFYEKYMTLRQDTSNKDIFKIGYLNVDGWGAYFNKGMAFIKKADHIANAVYPDCGSSYELYTDAVILEVESLSPLVKLDLEETITHVETWNLLEALPPGDNEEEISKKMDELLAKIK